MAQQVATRLRIAVDFASRRVDDPFVLEVVGQGVVAGGQSACTTDDGQRQHMGVVGPENGGDAKAAFFILQFLRIGGSQASRSIQLDELPTHAPIRREFLS